MWKPSAPNRRVAITAFIALLALCVGMRAAFASTAGPVIGHDHAQAMVEHDEQWLAEHIDADHSGLNIDGFHEHVADGVGTTVALLAADSVHPFVRSMGSPPRVYDAVRSPDPPSNRFRPPIV